jgi:tetratricopeptide (TPR) repeat protein
LAWARKEQGAPVDEVVAAFESALELAEAQGDHGTAADAHRQIGFIAWVRLHDRERCERNYEAAQRIADQYSLAKEVGAIHKELAYLTNEWGDLEAAERHSHAAIEAAEAVGDRYLLPGAATNLALVLERRGDTDAAQEWLERSIRQFEEFGNAGGTAYALHELGRILNQRGQREAALTQLERARKLCLDGGLTLQLRSIEATIQTIRDADVP